MANDQMKKNDDSSFGNIKTFTYISIDKKNATEIVS